MLLVEKHEVTQLLMSWSKGDRAALDSLTPILYDELRRLAAAHLRRRRCGPCPRGPRRRLA